MQDFRQAAVEKRWADIDYERLPEDDLDWLIQLRAQIQSDVGTHTIQNGTEQLEVSRTYEDVLSDTSIPLERIKHLKIATFVLDSQTLDALIEGEPATGPENWTEFLSIVHSNYRKQEALGEDTRGDERLSRSAHLRTSKAWHGELKILAKLSDPLQADHSSGFSSRECEIAYAVANMVAHLMLAMSKNDQSQSQLGTKVTNGGKKGARQQRANLSEWKKRRLEDRDLLAADLNLGSKEAGDILAKKYGTKPKTEQVAISKRRSKALRKS